MVKKERDRAVWSVQLCQLPEEDEAALLEEQLLSPGRSYWEDAERLRRYIALTGKSQSACAARLGRSQASVANRLRLFKLPEDIRSVMELHGLSERHARALLRLPTPEVQRSALKRILQEKMNVSQTEAYIEHIKASDELSIPEGLRTLAIELEKLKLNCPGVQTGIENGEDEIRLMIRIPRRKSK